MNTSLATITSWCRCTDPRKTELAGRLVVVEFRNGTIGLHNVTCFCDVCRGVIEPQNLIGRISSEERTFVRSLSSARSLARATIGQKGSARSNRLYRWILIDDLASVPHVRLAATYTDWQRGHKRSQVRNTLRRQVGLTNSCSSHVLQTPYKGGLISVDYHTVEHVMQDHDADHLSFFTLTASTLSDPLEIWQIGPDGKYAYRRLYFLKLYRIARTMTTHLVIVDDENDRVVTSYRLEHGDTRAEKHRHGKLIYASWG